MTEQQWRYHTPERDGHAPDDWVEGLETEFLDYGDWLEVTWIPSWDAGTRYRYRPLQDATYKPDLLAQCLALPQDQREALIEAMQKPQRDWADDVTDRIIAQRFGVEFKEANALTAAVIRSMCRPKEVELDEKWLFKKVNYMQTHGYKVEVLADIIREALI